MTHPPHLRPEDRADFAWVLNLALDVTDVRSALEQAPTAHGRRRLRAQAWAAADEITAAAADEYQTYLRARVAVIPASQRHDEPPKAATSLGAGALLPALAVLAPLISAGAAVGFLFLGYVLHLVTPQGQLAVSLVTAGGISAVASAVSAGVGLSCLLATAVRRRVTSTPYLTVRNPAAEQARNAWQKGLLERGMLPYLRKQLSASPPHPQ
ncbi:hypothetical protein [Streptomyces lasiicapitis]|uniref:Transmembrane protein n=1 Tax=Streptomyces lasiicapitis TaxID=1923961 RepID=A0ABQ2MV44_9ACTN|nr:hypothetical protein [Streptomyces lasiicapitis]GGO59354.1 hypothetical protein GCM10012286_80770 [Streptomyces lasiicapitis]